MKKILISIIIPVYNGERYIQRCVKSILSQTFREFELIIVNDNSTDKTLSLCRDIASIDNRIKLISVNKRGGKQSSQYRHKQGLRRMDSIC